MLLKVKIFNYMIFLWPFSWPQFSADVFFSLYDFILKDNNKSRNIDPSLYSRGKKKENKKKRTSKSVHKLLGLSDLNLTISVTFRLWDTGFQRFFAFFALFFLIYDFFGYKLIFINLEFIYVDSEHFLVLSL